MDMILHSKAKLEQSINLQFGFDAVQKVAYTIFHSLDFVNGSKRIKVAKALNMQPETLSRVLRRLVKSGVVDASANGKLSVLDSEALGELFLQQKLRQIFKKEKNAL